MILSNRDREILLHIESFGFATIKQIADLFFSKQKYGYDMARKRLNLMVKDKKLYVYRDYDINLNIYTLNKSKKAKPSDMLLLDFYCKMIFEGAEILFFEKEYTGLSDGKIRPDAFTLVKFENWVLYLFIEIQTRHAKADIEKYEVLYSSQEFQNKFETNIFPTVVVIEDVKHKSPYHSDNFKVVQLDLDMKGFPKIFLPK